MKDFGVTAICCTPSYFLHLIERAGELGVDLQEAAAARGRLRRRAVDRGDAPAHRSRTAASRPTTSTASRRSSARAWPSSARSQDGLHIFEDHFYPEIIDPETGEVAARRRRGRTGADHAEQAGDADDPLPHARHHRAHRRSRAPAAARSAASAASAAAATTCSSSAASTSSPRRSRPPCCAVEGTLPHYQIILTREKGLDQMEVQVEVTPEVFSDRDPRAGSAPGAGSATPSRTPWASA